MPSTVESANGIGPIVRAELLAEVSRVLATSLDPRVMLGSLASVVVSARTSNPASALTLSKRPC